jgi:hypothetical protein
MRSGCYLFAMACAGACTSGEADRYAPRKASNSDAQSAGDDAMIAPAWDDGTLVVSFAPFASLTDDLVGYWVLLDFDGNCANRINYLHLLPGGVAETILIDDDWCTPEQHGTFVTPATYSLEGRDLTLSVSESTLEPRSARRFPVAVGSFSGGRRELFVQLFLPLDELHWRSTYLEEFYNAEGVVLRNSGSVDLTFDTAIGASGEGDGNAEIAYTFRVYDTRDESGIGIPEARTQTFSDRWGPLHLHYAPSPLGQRIEMRNIPYEALDSYFLQYQLGPMLHVHRDMNTEPARYDAELWLSPGAPDYLFAPTGYLAREGGEDRLGLPP